MTMQHTSKREIVVEGPFTRKALTLLHTKNPFHLDDVIVSRNGERYVVVKIYQQLCSSVLKPPTLCDFVAGRGGRSFEAVVIAGTNTPPFTIYT